MPSLAHARQKASFPFRQFAALAGVGVLAATGVLIMSQPASAGIVPTVQLGTAADYSALAYATVTNTGPSVLEQSAGVFPGTAVTGFPPGTVLAPGTIEQATVPAGNAQADLNIAYLDAANRPSEFSITADLAGQTLAPGVYTGGSLGLTGELTLDGQGNTDAVFIFQAASDLTIASSSSITLINGVSPCNVFWQVTSSATIGTDAQFVGNIMALASVWVRTGATIEGRALALNGEVTLDDNVFTTPLCVPSGPPITVPGAASSTTVASAITVAPGATTVPGAGATTVPGAVVTTPASPGETTTTFSFNVTDITLPRTGSTATSTGVAGIAVLAIGAAALLAARRRRPI